MNLNNVMLEVLIFFNALSLRPYLLHIGHRSKRLYGVLAKQNINPISHRLPQSLVGPLPSWAISYSYFKFKKYHHFSRRVICCLIGFKYAPSFLHRQVMHPSKFVKEIRLGKDPSFETTRGGSPLVHRILLGQFGSRLLWDISMFTIIVKHMSTKESWCHESIITRV